MRRFLYDVVQVLLAILLAASIIVALAALSSFKARWFLMRVVLITLLAGLSSSDAA